MKPLAWIAVAALVVAVVLVMRKRQLAEQKDRPNDARFAKNPDGSPKYGQYADGSLVPLT